MLIVTFECERLLIVSPLVPKLRSGTPLSPQLCYPVSASTPAPRPTTETEFRPPWRSQTEFGNEDRKPAFHRP